MLVMKYFFIKSLRNFSITLLRCFIFFLF